jgi:DNA-binding NtrC family response regulator
MVTDAVARRQSRMISMEPFRNVISNARTRMPLPIMLAANYEERVRILEEIWGHFPTLHEAEGFLIESAMSVAQGNQGIAATMLGLKRQTLNMRLKVRKTRS